MASQSFAGQIAEWAKNVKGATEAIFKESAQEVVSVMQEPGPSAATTKKAIAIGAGLGKIKADGSRGNSKKAFGPVHSGGSGNIPVDTGFLRASLLASTSSMPLIEASAHPEEGKSYAYNEGEIEAVISGAEIGETLYFGYTAAYARAAEYGYKSRAPRRFVALAAQRWQEIVDQKASELKGRLGL
jgi:hypothetical protein